MFWGLIMEPQKRYSQVIKKAFHISMASLDVSNSDDQPAQILCGYEGKNYLLCTLQKPDKLQCNLDLYFEEGRSVSFASNGKSLIHLTGYLTKDMLEGESGEESDDESFECVQTKKKSRKDDGSLKEPSTKKLKLDHLFTDLNEEDESDDSDFNIEKVFEEESGEESEEEETEDIDMDVEDESMSEDDDDEDEEEDGDEDEEEDAEEEDSDEENVEEEEKVEKKAVQNGLSKKSKKNKKADEATTPTKKNKQAKEKLQLTPGPKQKKQEKTATENSTEKKGKGKEDKKPQESQSPVQKKKTLSNGIIIEDLKVGHGDPATNGKFIHVYYEGRLKNNNKVFDKSLNGPGFGFRLGKGEVIKGWDIGVSGMKVGGKRRIICPPQVAYGTKGSPPVIPPNSTLVFEVELRKVK